jgi:4-carboxymuconolactone decarboxylase
MPQEQPITQETIQKRRDFVPKLMELNEKVLFGDIWERPGLSKRDRSLITVATLVALYRINELPFHLVRARENGISKDELAELFTHLAFYAGWPSAITAVNIAMEVLAEQKSSCLVLKALRVFTKRKSTVFVHTSPVKTSTASHLIRTLRTERSPDATSQWQ